MKLEKVDLENLLEILSDLWERGVDYVDVAIVEGENRLSVSVVKEYLSEQMREKIEEMEQELQEDIEKEIKDAEKQEISKKSTKISDIDINDII